MWFVRRGSGDCDVLIADSFLCAVERRRGLVLGMELRWPSDACCLCLRELFVCCGGDVRRADDVFFLVQLGDNTTTSRSTPVAVVGLGQILGRCVAMLALGRVRLGL